MRGEYMQLDPKRALLVNELGDIVEELSSYKPVTQEQEAAYYKAIWMLDSVVSAFRKEDTSLEYEDNLAKYDEFYAKLPAKYHEYMHYWNAWVGAYEASNGMFTELTNKDEATKYDWYKFTQMFDYDTVVQSANILDATGTNTKELLTTLTNAADTNKMRDNLQKFSSMFVSTFPSLTPVAQLQCVSIISAEWLNSLQHVIQYKTIYEGNDPKLEKLLNKAKEDGSLELDEYDYNVFKNALVKNESVLLAIARERAFEQPMPYAALYKMFAQVGDKRSNPRKAATDFVNSLVLDTDTRTKYLQQIRNADLRKCMDVVLDICKEHPQAVVQLLPYVAAFYIDETRTATTMYIVPSSVETEDQTNPICVNKLALARAYIENVTAGKLPLLKEFTNKQQFNRVITDLLTGITGIPKSQSEQLSVDLHKIQKSADPISEFTTWFNNQPQQIQDLIIRAFPRYEFAKMLYEFQQLPDFDPKTVLEPGTYNERTASRLQEFKEVMQNKARENSPFYTTNGFINQMCIAYEITTSTSTVLQQLGGSCTFFHEVDSSYTDNDGLDYRMLGTFKWHNRQAVFAYQIDSKGANNTSAPTNIAQGVGKIVVLPEGAEYDFDLISNARKKVFNSFPQLTAQVHIPILRTIYKNTFEQQKPFFIDVLDSIEKLIISQDADPKTAARTIRNIPTYNLWTDCNEKADSPKRALTLFYGSLKELQKLLCKLLPGYTIEFLMSSYIRNTEPAQVESTAKGVDHKLLAQLKEATNKQEQEER